MKTVVEVSVMFQYGHLPDRLKDISSKFHETAMFIMDTVPEGPMRTNALNDLWQAKNWAVAQVAQAR